MRKALWGIVLALALSGAATAQTTTCRPSPLGTSITCETWPPPVAPRPPPSDNGPSAPADWRNVSPVPCNAFQRATLGSEVCGVRDVAAARKKVGEQIAAGDCDGALKGALATGDIGFAREVRDFCATAPAQ